MVFAKDNQSKIYSPNLTSKYTLFEKDHDVLIQVPTMKHYTLLHFWPYHVSLAMQSYPLGKRSRSSNHIGTTSKELHMPYLGMQGILNDQYCI
jgi:hypothetical protein